VALKKIFVVLFSFSRFVFEKLKVIKHKNGQMSLNLAQKKSKTAFFSTLKVGEK